GTNSPAASAVPENTTATRTATAAPAGHATDRRYARSTGSTPHGVIPLRRFAPAARASSPPSLRALHGIYASRRDPAPALRSRGARLLPSGRLRAPRTIGRSRLARPSDRYANGCWMESASPLVILRRGATKDLLSSN